MFKFFKKSKNQKAKDLSNLADPGHAPIQSSAQVPDQPVRLPSTPEPIVQSPSAPAIDQMSVKVTNNSLEPIQHPNGMPQHIINPDSSDSK
jgi:hypothetical protein